MIYALVDIGNTYIKIKIIKDTTTIVCCNVGQTPVAIESFFLGSSIDKFLVSSVVPSINKMLQALNKDHIILLNHNHFTDLKLHVEPVESIGIDRLVNAVAVTKKWNANVIIVDVGTCVTFCRIKAGGEYLGGIIAPGFQMIRNALYTGAEQLPHVGFPSDIPNLIGTTTEKAMHSGIYFGSMHLINGIIDELRQEDDKASVVLTGGIPAALIDEIHYDTFEPDLQFLG